MRENLLLYKWASPFQIETFYKDKDSRDHRDKDLDIFT